MYIELVNGNKECIAETSNLNGIAVCNTHSFIGAMVKGDFFVYFGLKSNAAPFNIFEKKVGKSYIIALDFNLIIAKQHEFDFGDVVSLKFEYGSLFALFANGYIVKIPESHHEKYTILESAHKIIAFDVEAELLAYTNGSTLFSNGKSKTYDGLIIGLVLYQNNVITLDINGKVCITDRTLLETKDLTSKYTITQMKLVNSNLIVFEDAQYTILHPFESTEEEDVAFYSITSKGEILYNKKRKGRKKVTPILYVYKKEQYTFLSSQSLGHEYDHEHIVDVISDEQSVIFSTENGIVIKIPNKQR
ncbi:hypothetical protein GINT2_000068 [Glugoides intestinalis]